MTDTITVEIPVESVPMLRRAIGDYVRSAEGREPEPRVRDAMRLVVDAINKAIGDREWFGIPVRVQPGMPAGLALLRSPEPRTPPRSSENGGG